MDSFAKYKRGEVGCDEAGRGCIAGPVVAAAVMLNPNNIHPLINDSKKLNAVHRSMLYEWIKANAIDYAVGVISVEQIDRENILQASISGMHQALDQLTKPFKYILVDGNKFRPYQKIQHLCVVKGDAKFASIAAASIVAKVYRDKIMDELHLAYPEFEWSQNKGYPSLKHRAQVLRTKPSPHHRTSFVIKPSPALEKYMQRNVF